jgi:hypothetical protein
MEGTRTQHFVAIVNNGFPEPEHNLSAIEICRRFAMETGFVWAGGLIVGGGAALGGRPLEETGGMTRNLRETLDKAAEVIARGESIPKEVEQEVGRQLYPSYVPTLFGGLGWWWQKRKEGGKGSLRARPYER